MNNDFAVYQEKHLIFYFLEDKTQRSPRTLTLPDASENLMVITFTLTTPIWWSQNRYVYPRAGEQEITSGNGQVNKTVSPLATTIPERGPIVTSKLANFVNGTYRDYVRLYVPKAQTN